MASPPEFLRGPVAALLLLNTLMALAQASTSVEPAVYPDSIPVKAPPPSEPQTDEPPTRLDDIIVTATKREQVSREVAGSVSALSGDDLETIGAQDMEDYLKLVPGVALNKGDTEQNAPAIRGITTSTFFESTQLPTGIYIDEAPFNDPIKPISAPDIHPFDLERVEILKGPQGTLFGSASLAGAIRYITRKPELGVWDSRLMVSGLEQAHSDGIGPIGALMVNAPLYGDSLALRAVGMVRRNNGYVDDISQGADDVNELRQRGGRVLALWEPSDALRVTASYLSQRTSTRDISFSDNRTDWTRADTPTASPAATSARLGNLSVEYAFESATLLSSTSRTGKDADRTLNGDRTFALDQQSATHVVINSHGRGDGWTEELRLTSRDKGQPWKWMLGAFYLRYDMRYLQALTGPENAQNGGAAGVLVNALGVLIPPGLEVLPGAVLFSNDQKLLEQESALFGEGSWRFWNEVELTAGLRYYRTHQDADLRSEGALTLATSAQYQMHVVDSTQEDGLSPKLSLTWQPSRDFMTYALASRGFRPGGVQIVPTNVPGLGNGNRPYKSDRLWNYEVGVRSRWLSSLTTDATLFYLDWRDLQVFQFDQFNIATFVDNVGRARSRGLETTLAWRPTQKWLNGFSFLASAAWIDARTRVEFNSSQGMVPPDTPLPGTPRFQASATANVVVPLWTWLGNASASYSYTGRAFNNLQKQTEVGDYGLVDLRLSVAPPHARTMFEPALWVHNLFDTPGVSSAYGSSFVTSSYTDYFLTKPRTFGLSLTVEF